MPEFSAHPSGSPCWIDLMSPDVDASKAFYSAVFSWDAEDQFDDDGTRVYAMFSLNGKSVAGLGGQAPGMEGAPAFWNSYISVDDCEATAAAVVNAGGSVMMPPMEVMTAGHMAIFTDPTGAAFSVWKAGDHHGAELANEPNTWSWNELQTRDTGAALTFYSTVFGWSYEAMDMGPMGTYNVIAGGPNGGLGGIVAMPPEAPDQVPNHWSIIFTVADLDASLEAVKNNGGQIAQPPFEVPGIGITAAVHDPNFAAFQMLQPSEG